MVQVYCSIQEPLTRPGVNLDEKISILLFDSLTRGVYKFQHANMRRRCESEKMSCHATLKNLHEPKMGVILTINFKITAEIEITKRKFCVLLCRRGRVSAFCQA